MTTVKFNDLEEFIAELTQDQNQVERGIVRLTCQHRAHGELPITYVSVVATAQVAGYLVKLEKPIGDFVPGFEEQRQQLAERAEQLLNTLQTRCEPLGFEARAGLLLNE